MSSRTYPILSAAEAAEFIADGSTVGFSGFTPAGAAKAIPVALAAKAKRLHAEGKPFKLRVLTGASTGAQLDETLAQAKAIAWRAPYQSSKSLRQQMNRGEADFVDMHLSHVPQAVLEGFFGKLDWAVVEATEVTPDGRVYLTSSIGASPTYLKCAERVIIEVNRYHSHRVREMADIAILPPPPLRSPIGINDPLTKIGSPYAVVDPKKIVAVVEHDEADGVSGFDPPNHASRYIAENVVRFFLDEMRAGRIPPTFLPLQSGVGNVANAVMACLGEHDDIPPFTMYTEVFQDALVPLMESGKLLGASSCSLTVTDQLLKRMYDNMDFFGDRIVLRPQEFSNNPGVVRRLGVISTNTAIEVDIYGNANSTHVCGMQMMNGIGGSGDFTRNAFLSVFMCPSVSKRGAISNIVPMVPHVDHNEHSVQIVVTEQGLADLRGLAPLERARTIINKCAHPMYRDYLHRYIERSPMGHIRHDLERCFEMHRNLMEHGHMLPGSPLLEAD